MNNEQVNTRVEELQAILSEHNHRYYVLDDPMISDAEYDRLFRELQDIERAHPELLQSNSQTKRVGGTVLDEFSTLKHRIPMLSLGNALNENELREFYQRLRKLSNLVDLELVGEPKLDGLGVELIYRKMLNLLAAEGVIPLTPEGEIFNPNLHEAIMQTESDEHESDQIIEVLQHGYMIGERVLRPAMVRIAA